MRIDDIDALLATVQFSSLNQAAEYLGITQSAITRRLQRLEQELNVTLLERQTRPLTLTAAGHRVYEQCLSIKRETKKLYSLLDPEGEPRGALRLGVPQSLSEIALPAALSALSSSFPDCRRRSPAAGADSCSAGWKTASWTACWRWGPPSKASPRATAGACCVPWRWCRSSAGV